MFQNKINKLIPAGDYMTKEEAILDRETDIKRRCETVADVVKNKIFTLPQALKAYDVSIEEYFGYMMLKPKKQKIIMDVGTVAAIMNALLNIMDLSHANLDNQTKKVVSDLRKLSAVK